MFDEKYALNKKIRKIILSDISYDYKYLQINKIIVWEIIANIIWIKEKLIMKENNINTKTYRNKNKKYNELSNNNREIDMELIEWEDKFSDINFEIWIDILIDEEKLNISKEMPLEKKISEIIILSKKDNELKEKIKNFLL